MSWHFIDTHCHFDFPPFTGDEPESLKRAAEAGVSHLIVPATEAERFATVLELAERHPEIRAAIGLHPIVITHHNDASLALLEHHLRQRHESVVAIGEIGLDLYMEEPLFEQQEMLLDAQLKLAKQYQLPVILHSRRTHDKLAMHLKRHTLPRTGVVHAFAGSQQQAERFIELGYKIGVGGTITYPRASKTRDVIKHLPLSALLLETDSPDMPLNGFQGQPNRPERVAAVFDVLCELRPEPPRVIADALLTNTHQLFAI